MERQDHIRKALDGFLQTRRRPESPYVIDSAAVSPTHLVQAPVPTLTVSEAQWTALRDLQDLLREHGIEAELEEIGYGILEALAARPSLCRGLLASYFLDV